MMIHYVGWEVLVIRIHLYCCLVFGRFTGMMIFFVDGLSMFQTSCACLVAKCCGDEFADSVICSMVGM